MPENEKKGITVKVDAELHAEVRQYIEAHIRLLSCNTGSLQNGIAQQLANRLNVKVTAPNKYLWANIYGNLSIYGSKNGRYANYFDPGEWIEFLPIYK